MELIKVVDGKPVAYSEAAFRTDNKNTIYGVAISNRQLNEQGVYRVRSVAEPKEVGKIAIKDSTPTLIGNIWTKGWTLQVKSADALREERDAALKDTDWMSVSDRTMSEAEIAYRQSLRDLPQQDGFPITHTWPDKPIKGDVV